MKRKLLLVTVFISMAFLVGCSNFLNFPTTQAPTDIPTLSPIDIDQLKDDVYQDVYNQIYSELFANIKNKIVSEISDDELNDIYQRVKLDILNKIENGEIEVEALSVMDKMITTSLTSAQAVVGIKNLDSKAVLKGIGSGVIYKRVGNKYFVVTNHHVIEEASRIEIQFEDKTLVQAELLGVDKLVDVAILSFTSTRSFQVSSFGDSSLTKQGEFISAVGNPTSFDYFNTMTMGIVSGINRYFDIDGDGTRDMFVNYIQHDAAINAGNSGGALFNLDGEIIGINTLKIVDETIEGMGFAIPGNLVKRIADDIEEFGYSRIKPMLGISFIDIFGNRDYFTAKNIPLPESITKGFYVESVVVGASVYGHVLAKDIILQIGDVEIIDTQHFIEGFSKYLIGDIIDITVYRNGQTIILKDVELKGKD